MSNRAQLKAMSRAGIRCRPFVLVSGVIFACLSAGGGGADSRFLLFPDFTNTNLRTLEGFGWKFRPLQQPLLANGHRTLHYVEDFNTLYTNAREFCLLGPEPLGTNAWVIQTSFHRRYILRMVTPFTLDTSWTNILSYDPPIFKLLEWREKRRFGFYAVCSFGATNWPKLVASGGDLSVIGIKLKTNSPVEDFEYHYEGANDR